MEVLNDIADLERVPGPVHLAIGVFDGLHCGHQAVIRAAQQAADNAAENGSVVVVTFDPHPARLIAPDRAPRLLTSHRHLMALLADFGIDRVLVVNFDEAFSKLSGSEFVEQLQVASPSLRTICVGKDWNFGFQRSGNVALLRELGEEHGFSVAAVPTVKVGGATASSTAIRHAVAHGDFQLAAAMLGRPYTVLGTVVKGRQLGRTLGFPTANLQVHNEQLPPSGVYAVTVRRRPVAANIGAGEADEESGGIPGVANLGHRPTVEAEEPALRQLEVHLFDFSEVLYGCDLEVRFVRFLRGERKFDGIDLLKNQIELDSKAARKALARLQA